MENLASSLEILPNERKQNWKFKDVIVLETQLENFRAKGQNFRTVNLINKDLSLQEKQFMQIAANVLYPEAVKDYLNSTINGYPFHAHEAVMSYNTTLNQNCFFSYFYDTYIFTGGAHGTTTRKSKSYNLNTGRTLQLENLFENNSNYRAKTLEIITAQAEKNYNQTPGIYFENYKQLIRKNFNPESFYLSPEGVVIYYGQYEIAPYSTGIVEFVVPYSDTNFVPSCK